MDRFPRTRTTGVTPLTPGVYPVPNNGRIVPNGLYDGINNENVPPRRVPFGNAENIRRNVNEIQNQIGGSRRKKRHSVKKRKSDKRRKDRNRHRRKSVRKLN